MIQERGRETGQELGIARRCAGGGTRASFIAPARTTGEAAVTRAKFTRQNYAPPRAIRGGPVAGAATLESTEVDLTGSALPPARRNCKTNPAGAARPRERAAKEVGTGFRRRRRLLVTTGIA